MLSAENIRATLMRFGVVREHEPLAHHTTMHTGGSARWFLSVADPQRVPDLLLWLDDALIAWEILGGGSNSVAMDAGVDGVVIHPVFASLSMHETGEVIAETGMFTALFARQVTEAGFTGWEWGVGLPGMLGGALVGNAGCFGGEARDHLAWVEAYSVKDRAVRRLSFDACMFHYRDSFFKHERFFLLRASWHLERTNNHEASLLRMKTVLAERKSHQPLGVASAGCLFKNSEADEDTMRRMEALFGSLPSSARRTGRIPAGWLLDRLQCKGISSGGMSVSSVHANFAVQRTGATTEDLLHLRQQIQTRVREATGIILEPEIRLLG